MSLGLRLRLGLRTGLRRSSLSFWSVALALAAGTGFTVSHQVAEASARAARLGGLRDVPVATRHLPAGHVLHSSDVSVRRLPAAAVPDGPVAHSAAGRSSLVPLSAGEVLLAAKLAPDGLHGIAALLPPGMRALAVPVQAGGLALERGHHVDVLATFDAELQDGAGAGGGSGSGRTDDGAGDGSGDDGDAGGRTDDGADAGVAPTFPVATGALVLDAGEDSATIAVSPEEAPRVAFALARGTVTLALTSSG